MKDLIELQNSHVTQITTHGIPSEWYVKENVTGRRLHSLPETISDRDMTSVMDFAKIFELKAFNAGINFQKGKQNAPLQQRIKALQEELRQVLAHDSYIANLLEKALNPLPSV